MTTGKGKALPRQLFCPALECDHHSSKPANSSTKAQPPLENEATLACMALENMDQAQSAEWEMDLEYAAFEGFGPQDTNDGIEYYWEDSEPLPWWKCLIPPFLR